MIRVFCEIIPDPSSPQLYKTLSSILITCRLWYNIILGAPIMWSIIRLSDATGPSPHQIARFFERSQSCLLGVYVHLDDTRSSIINRRILEEKEAGIKHLLRAHMARVQTLHFDGGPHRFFPLEVSTPELRHIKITSPLFSTSKPESPLPIFSSLGGCIRTLETKGNDMDIFQGVDPLCIEHFSVDPYAVWDQLMGDSFLRNARYLRVLRLPNNALRNSPDVFFELPLLEELRLGEPWSALTRHFGLMPKLSHLTLARYSPYLYNLSPVECPTWPGAIFLSLQTLTLDHFNLPNLTPLFITSPSIQGIHLHGSHGFLDILHILASKNNDNGVTKNHTFLSKLRYLRLWPLCDHHASRPSPNDTRLCIDVLVTAMHIRPQLRVEIGTTIYEWVVESPDDPGMQQPTPARVGIYHGVILIPESLRLDTSADDSEGSRTYMMPVSPIASTARSGQPPSIVDVMNQAGAVQ
ncbi:hypothetical protein DL93DRAFT_2230732 [Clavulina sp. PMI_390]|nr:hypothetical protein DL93DRAFT_2230732 [Clavulina sp. PMI_390]